MKKISKNLYYLLIAVLMIITSCTYYRTISVEPTESALETHVTTENNIYIHNADGKKKGLLNSPSIDGSTLSGQLEVISSGIYHEDHKKSFRRGMAKDENADKAIHLYTTEQNLSQGNFEINVNDLQSIEYHEKNAGKTLMGILGVLFLTLLAGIIGIYIILLISCGCPQVSSVDSGDVEYHGSLFPGALFESVEREDYLILDKPLVDVQQELTLRIANEMPEDQFINYLEVLQVQLKEGQSLAINQNSELISYGEVHKPLKSYSVSSLLQVNSVSADDGISYDFTDYYDEDHFNQLVLEFEKPVENQSAALFLKAKQTQWLDTLASVAVYQAGENYESWTSKQDKADGSKWLDRNEKRGVALTISVFQDGEWVTAGTLHDVGSTGYRNIVIPLSAVSPTDQLKVKLECAYGVWEIDQAGLVLDWDTNLEIKSLPAQSIRNEKGEDVSDLVARTDDQYYNQASQGQFVEMKTKMPADLTNRSIVLKGGGYFHKTPEMDHKMNLPFFIQFRQKKGLHKLSIALKEELKRGNVSLEAQ